MATAVGGRGGSPSSWGWSVVSQNALEDLRLLGAGAEGRGGRWCLVRGGETDLRGFLACAGGVAENWTGEGPALLKLRLRLPSSAERARSGERSIVLEVDLTMFVGAAAAAFGGVRWTSLSTPEDAALSCNDDVDMVLHDVLDELDLFKENTFLIHF